MTVSGSTFDFTDPTESIIDINDIAHALSNICRFNGHVKEFYSVAQHSVLVSYEVPEKHAMAGLLHDAAEAFLGDVTRPLKNLLPDYAAIEQRVELAVFRGFGLTDKLPKCVHEADLVLLATEKRDLMPVSDNNWECIAGIEPRANIIRPMSPSSARELFLLRFEELTMSKGKLG
jgi:hypothetical protein